VRNVDADGGASDIAGCACIETLLDWAESGGRPSGGAGRVLREHKACCKCKGGKDELHFDELILVLVDERKESNDRGDFERVTD